MIDLSPELAAQRGRTTSAAPSLSPQRRAIRDYRERQQAKAEAAANDAEAKDKAAEAPDGQRTRTVKDAAGTFLQPDEFMRRLTKLTSKLHFEVSKHDSSRMGIYIKKVTEDPDRPLQYVTAFNRLRPIPEFTVFKRLGPERVVVDLMGWRTALLRLMKERVITKTQIEVIFGPPGMDSKNWQLLSN